MGPAGYVVACAICETNLALGRTVVADCVNPLSITRAAWRDVATRTAAPIFEVEVICSDEAEHRRRVESREIDIPGLIPPTWAAVMARDYEPWSEPTMVVDTAQTTTAEAVACDCRRYNAAIIRTFGRQLATHCRRPYRGG